MQEGTLLPIAKEGLVGAFFFSCALLGTIFILVTGFFPGGGSLLSRGIYRKDSPFLYWAVTGIWFTVISVGFVEWLSTHPHFEFHLVN
ncbi:hypothetical protein [Phenylobacterium montanum]|uniref:Uncharacterized protein n=1 Tax=Phenylobacterium montanum TaxID=2823693 RepID=A0A975G2D3_9CAUL|nr:hypothetical protein [Caulobacter sp. S6]QUD89855.1 hypothetical protein KCG34_08290 [Caulobacter sp. S6]